MLYDRYTEDRDAIRRHLAQTQGLTLIPPQLGDLTFPVPLQA